MSHLQAALIIIISMHPVSLHGELQSADYACAICCISRSFTALTVLNRGSTNMASLGTVQLIRDAEQCEVQVSQVTPLSVAAMFEVCYTDIEQCYIPLASPWHIIMYTILTDGLSPLLFRERLFQIVGVRS